MESTVYDELTALEDGHWWFKGRRRLAQALLDRKTFPADAHVLEIGCGSGGNLAMLARYGNIHACEMNPAARAVANKRQLTNVADGMLPDALPYPEITFDVVALFDVLEHVEDDAAALNTIHSKLKPGGYALFTVPAYPWLWSPQDEMSHHKRRYTHASLTAKVKAAGFAIETASYYQLLLFPLVLLGWLRHTRAKAAHSQNADTSLPPVWRNNTCYRLLAMERFPMRWFSLPFGPSLILLARKL